MKKQILITVLWVVVAIILLWFYRHMSHNDNAKPTSLENEKAVMTAPIVQYKDRHSGYQDPDGTKMQAFLQCWKQQTIEWATEQKMQQKMATVQGRYQDKNAENLPPSVVHFWQAANQLDWFSIYDIKEEKPRFFAPSEIKYLKEIMPEDYQILKETRSVATVDRYYIYNSDQWAISAADIDDYVVYGTEGHGVFYGEIRNEQSLDGEYQFIFWSPGNQLSIRFKSFAHLLANFYLEEYQLVNKKDTSFGHIYYFKDDYNKTCVPLLFDADEIATWKF